MGFRISSFRGLALMLTALVFFYWRFRPSYNAVPRGPDGSRDAELAARIQQAAALADTKIYFLNPKSFDANVLKAPGVSVVFFSIKECPFCQAFTPEWLKFQEKLAVDKLPLHVAKFDCTSYEEFCSQLQFLDGYPTIIMYKDGVALADLYADNLHSGILYTVSQQAVVHHIYPQRNLAAAAPAKDHAAPAVDPDAEVQIPQKHNMKE